jgi:DNA invertase Pin-like site-specific DNA recombinase
LKESSLTSARWRGSKPRALDEEDIPQVQSLMQNPDVSTAQICERFEISKATLYCYVGPDGKRRR